MVPVRSRNTILSLLLLGIASAALRVAAAGDVPPVQGDVAHFNLYDRAKPAPDAGFSAADGSALSLADYRGKVLLVNFWATWCAPCVREMPELDALQAALGGETFQVLAINQDRGGAKVAEPYLRERLGLQNLPLLLDSSWGFGQAMKLRGLPTTFLIDADGGVVGDLEGIADWNGEDARALIGWYIDRVPSPRGGEG